MNANSAYAELISLDWNAPDVTFPPVRRPTNASGETSTSFGDVPTPSIPATSDSGSEEVVIERSQVDEIFDSGLRESVSPGTRQESQDMLSSSASPYSPRSPVWSPNFPPTDTDLSEPTNVPSLTLAGSAQSATSTFTPQPLAWAPNYGPVNTTSEPATTPLTLMIGAPTTSPRPPRPAFGPRSPVWSSNFTTTDTGPSEPINIPSSTPVPSPSTQRLWQYPEISYTRETTSTDQPRPYEHQFNQHWAERERRIRERETTASPSDRIVHVPQLRGANRGLSLAPVLATPLPVQHPSHLSPRPPRIIACPSSLRMPTREPILERPDVPGRNAALTTISNILFNFDIHPEEAADLLEDACATAQSVGVSTHELLAQTVCFGNEDLGVTPLYLEASRWDLGGETDLVAWLIEHSPVDVVERDLKRACLSRCSGMGEQLAWSTLKLFVPERPDQAVFPYDVVVEAVGFVPDGARLLQAKEEIVEDDEDEGSLYDDVSFIDQADIETLKSSEDEPVAEPAEVAVEPPLGRTHRARLDVPLFKEALTFEEEHVTPAYTALPPWNQIPSKLLGELPPGVDHSRYAIPHMPMKNRVLTAEWMFEGRLWALAMGEEKLVLTLRQTSDQVSKKPIKVKAMIRVFPVDVQWDGFEELTTLGSDQLLPTHEPTDVLLIPPSYTCEFDETELVPGPPTLKGKSSLSRDGIHMSSLSLLEMVGLSGAMKVEVTIKTTEVPEIPVPQPSTSGKEKASDDEQDKGEWQLVD